MTMGAAPMSLVLFGMPGPAGEGEVDIPNDDEANAAATKLQAIQRGKQARKDVEEKKASASTAAASPAAVGKKKKKKSKAMVTSDSESEGEEGHCHTKLHLR